MGEVNDKLIITNLLADLEKISKTLDEITLKTDKFIGHEIDLTMRNLVTQIQYFYYHSYNN